VKESIFKGGVIMKRYLKYLCLFIGLFFLIAPAGNAEEVVLVDTGAPTSNLYIAPGASQPWAGQFTILAGNWSNVKFYYYFSYFWTEAATVEIVIWNDSNDAPNSQLFTNQLVLSQSQTGWQKVLEIDGPLAPGKYWIEVYASAGQFAFQSPPPSPLPWYAYYSWSKWNVFPGTSAGFALKVTAEEVLDSDGDGVPDDLDFCPDSIIDTTIKIGDFDTGVNNFIDESGCTLADGISEALVSAASNAKNHGQFIRAMAHYLNELVESELITWDDHGVIMEAINLAY
jgi:hypothetical protein